jgi:hypothetical protein
VSSETRLPCSDQTTDERLAEEGLPFHRAAFVGRGRELRRLQSAFEAAAGRKGALIMLVGEPGVYSAACSTVCAISEPCIRSCW